MCYNYLSCIGSRILAELMPGHADQWRLSSFRQAPFYIWLLIYFCLISCYNQKRKHMQNQVSNLDKLTLSNDFLFKHVMLRKRSASIFWKSFYTQKLQISPILKQNRHLMFIPTAMVFVWMLELQMLPILITIWKCR